MDGLVALFRTCTECLKSILTTQQFGTEYELLCSELSVQWLRIRLWGESVGLHLEDAHLLQNSLLSRPEVESTITQSVNCIAYILQEIEVVRRKYELRPRLELITDSSFGQVKISGVGLPDVANGLLQRRMKDNQKQKSFLAITKWALCDSRRFDEKVKKLKSMIDGLEDISQAAGITRPTATSQPAVTEISPPEEESPPPYSFEPPTSRRPSQATIPEPVVPAATAPFSSQGSVLLQHYTVLRTFLGPTFADAGHRVSRAQDKLSRLTYTQFKELRTDVYDELIRRQDFEPTYPFLQPSSLFCEKRNQARKKLSTLADLRYTDLVTDVISELDRRYPHLQEEMPKSIDPFSSPRSPTTRRYGCVLPPNTPPPALHERPIHRSFTPQLSTSSLLLSATPQSHSRPIITEPLTPLSPSSTISPTSPRAVEIFKTFRVCYEDPTWKVLPVALQKYNINAPPANYELWLVHHEGEECMERCLGAEEKPLAVFKQLDKAGKKPMFMMKKKPGCR